MKSFNLGSFSVGEGEPLLLILGPCVIESEEHTLRLAEKLKHLAAATNCSFLFKASYDKANRSSIHSFRGPGLEEGLRILDRVRRELDVPVTTDIHATEEAAPAAEVCEMIQIPAFLCRQTDLIAAAGATNAAVNVKKGQFMAPWDMKNVLEKLHSCGNQRVLLTDRGTSFGYNNLVTDFRAIPIMQDLGVPVCYDASHSVQLPGGLGSRSGGQREFIPVLARAAVAAGCNALFLECHDDPPNAKSDAATVFPLEALPRLLRDIEAVHRACSATR